MTLSFGSVCSGIGGIDLGLERAGWRCLWQVEKDKKRRTVLGEHWPDVPKMEDLRDVASSDSAPPRVDLLAGGTPCQDFSVAGRRAGLDGDRGSLFIDFVRLADRLGAPWILWENVPGVLYGDGALWSLLLEGFTGNVFEPPAGGWKTSGCAVGSIRWACWRVLDAQFFGIPQRRRRVFVVAGPRERPAPEVLFESEGVSRTASESESAGPVSPTLTAGRSGGGSWGRLDTNELLIPVVFDEAQVYHGENQSLGAVDQSYTVSKTSREIVVFSPAGAVAPTLTKARDDSGSGNNPHPGVCVMHGGKGVRVLTPRERERLQGLPDDWTRWAGGGELSWSFRRSAVGDSVAVPVVEWIGRRLLTAAEKGR